MKHHRQSDTLLLICIWSTNVFAYVCSVYDNVLQLIYIELLILVVTKILYLVVVMSNLFLILFVPWHAVRACFPRTTPSFLGKIWFGLIALFLNKSIHWFITQGENKKKVNRKQWQLSGFFFWAYECSQRCYSLSLIFEKIYLYWLITNYFRYNF